MKCINSFLSASVHRNSKIAEMGKMHVFRFHVVWFNHWVERSDIEGVEKRETRTFCQCWLSELFVLCSVLILLFHVLHNKCWSLQRERLQLQLHLQQQRQRQLQWQ